MAAELPLARTWLTLSLLELMAYPIFVTISSAFLQEEVEESENN